jgi:acyl-homoserine-lactone acylase
MGFGRGSSGRLTAACAAALAAAAAAALALLPAGASGPRPAQAAPKQSPKAGSLHATIRRTTYGIPHILASDFASLGFGYGYAFAQDNICTIAESYVTVNAQRSRYFGPDGSWRSQGNGSTNNNLNSDFFYQRINDSGIIERLLDQAPPAGPKPEVKEGVAGYVAGYNKYLRDTGVDNLPDPRCRGKEWVRPITEMDAYRRFYQLASLASQGVAIDGIGKAQPLTGSLTGQAAAERRLRADPGLLRPPIGSNAYGLGKDATDNGRGMVLGNPHFPWTGPERLYQAQLTIPGKLDVAGASLYGVPLVLIGHTDGLAWSHTVATAFRFTPFELTLAPHDPTSYVVDGQVKKMQADRVTVKVRNPDGSLSDRSRTLYRTEYGPMLTEILGLPLFPWTNAKAYAMRDANEENFRYLNHFFDTNLAQSVREYDDIERRYQGIPWVNSIAADAGGESYYSMEGAIPNVPDEKVRDCPTLLGQVTFNVLGLPTLDGARSECNWDDDPEAAGPGIFPPGKVPRLFRDDFVHNGNDSHWLSNPKEPLTGFARIIGDEETQRTLRTRLGLVQVEDRLSGRDGLPGDRMTLADLQEITLGNRQYAGELWRDQLVEMCEQSPVEIGSRGPVDVSAACPVLAGWDLRDNLDSKGSVLFRRFATHALGANLGAFAEGFSKDDPVHTPRGLNTSNPEVRAALADAVQDLRDAGIPLDAGLRNHQWSDRDGRIPIHGGPGGLGLFNAISAPWRGDSRGFGPVDYGSSFIMAMQFTGGDCPVRSRTFVTYGQSENPDSSHFADQTHAFSRKDWNTERYCEPDIAADPNLAVTTIDEPCAGPTKAGEGPAARRCAASGRSGRRR